MCAEVETPLPILPGYRADQARKSKSSVVSRLSLDVIWLGRVLVEAPSAVCRSGWIAE